MRRDEAPSLEGVADDGEMLGPVGVAGAAPELNEGEEDVLV